MNWTKKLVDEAIAETSMMKHYDVLCCENVEYQFRSSKNIEVNTGKTESTDSSLPPSSLYTSLLRWGSDSGWQGEVSVSSFLFIFHWSECQKSTRIEEAKTSTWLPPHPLLFASRSHRKFSQWRDENNGCLATVQFITTKSKNMIGWCYSSSWSIIRKSGVWIHSSSQSGVWWSRQW